jgi:hypothetical protein
MTVRLLVLVALQLVASAAAACRFAQDAQPAQWHEWAVTLFAGEVTTVEPHAERARDVVAVRVLETFKGPHGAAAARLEVPSRMWSSCRLERPVVGAQVLVALNANSDTLILPLTPHYAERLRQHRAKPSPAAPPAVGEAPFHY